MRSTVGIVQGAGATLGLLLALGCGSSATRSDADTDADMGGAGASDAWLAPLDESDAAIMFGLDGGASADTGGPSPPPEGADPDATGNARSCFDGRDSDGDTRADCADDGCTESRVCCVGSAALACCAPTPTTTNFEIGTCEGNPEACVTLIDAGLAPRVVSGAPLFGEDHALVPVSTDRVDAVVDFPALELTPRGEHITVRATISAPPMTAQLDATAVGLWTAQSAAGSVSPLAAVVVSATRGDVSLVVGDRVVDRADLTPGATDYALEVTPDGTVTARFDAATLSASITLPAGRVVPVVFGRVTNDAPGSATTRVTALSVERRACDLPDALVRVGPLTAPGETSYEVLHASDPSVLPRPAGDDLVAFAAPSMGNATRSLYVASRGTDGRLEAPSPVVTLATLGDLATPIIATDLGGPHLFLDPEGRVSLYFAYETSDDRWHLARLDDLGGTQTVTPLDIPDGSYDDPAPLAGNRLLARERLEGGGSRLVVIDLTEFSGTRASGFCASESSCEDGRPDVFIHGTSADPLAFDRDEVRAPVAIEHAGVRRIYFAGRRGTRWSIGMLLEGDGGTYFRVANGGEAVLGPSGVGVDTLGAAGPAPVVRNGELELVYAGTDGAGWQLLSTRMPLRAP